MKYRVLIIGILFVLGIWLFSMLGIFRLPNALLYDCYVRLTPEIRTTSSNILLVEADNNHRDGGNEIWLRLLEILEDMEPKQILFTFFPQETSDEFYRTAERYSNVLFGREVLVAPHKRHELTPEPLPKAFDKQKLRSGLVIISQSYHGIYRYQYFNVFINGQSYPSLEHVAVQTGQTEQTFSRINTYLVNFNGKFNGMPKITLERVLSKDIVADLVKGKYVLVGFRKSHLDPGLHTPLTPIDGMSLLEFHGHALDTLLADKVITETHDGMKLVLLTFVVLFGLIAYQFLNIRLFSWFVLPIGCIYASIVWLAFSYFFIWLPVAEVLTTHLLTFLFVFLRRVFQQEYTTQKMLMQRSFRLRDRVMPESFYDTQEYWTQIINMVNQTLELNRAIFLESRRGDHYVREIKALNCSLSDISERRRDYRRTPYSTAIHQNGPIKMENFLFLKRVQTEEVQYLVPLIFGGQVLGFWAFGIESSKIARIANFNSVITNFGNQISELLYRRERKQLQYFSEEKELLKYLRLEGGDAALRRLNNSIVLLEHRLTLLEKVFDGVSTAIILYDLFGQILHVNKNMSELMTNSGFLPYKMAATDFASAVSHLPVDEVRHLLRRLLFDREPITLPASLPSEQHKHYMLYIRPLTHEQSDTLPEDAYPFQTYGILFELLEITELKMFSQLKDELFDHINYKFRRDLEPIILACSLFEEKNLPEEKRKSVLKILYTRIDKMLTFIKQVGRELLEDTFIGEIEYFPVNPKQSIDSAVNALTGQAQSRKITFDIEMPESVGMVCAGPDALVDVIKAIVTVLITDAIENSHIRIVLIETDEEMVYGFSNTGFGMPNDVFQQYLFEDTDVTSPEFKRLRNAILQVQQWGGSIRASSNVGEGTRFNMHLKSSPCQKAGSKKQEILNTEH